MSFQNRKLIIFDFDGTIADTAEIFVQVNNRNHKDYGTKFVSVEDVSMLKKMSDRQALAFLDINVVEFFLIARRFLREIHGLMPTAPIYTGMKELLAHLHSRGKMLSIVSRNSVPNIKSFLKANNIEHINELYSETLVKGKHKILLEILKKHKLSKSDTVFIGDRLSDYFAAKKAQIDFIFVTWGYGDPSKLSSDELQYIAHSVTDLKKLLDS